MDVYRERAHLVAYLASVYPSWFAVDANEPEWPVVYIDTPEGQMSWHISKGDLDLFHNIPDSKAPKAWDGHSTEEKYERLRRLTENN